MLIPAVLLWQGQGSDGTRIWDGDTGVDALQNLEPSDSPVSSGLEERISFLLLEDRASFTSTL